MRSWHRIAAGGLAVVLTTGVARAHEVGAERLEAPLPLAALYAGAGLTVAVTAGCLAATSDRRPGAGGRRELLRIRAPTARRLRSVTRGLFLLAVLGALVAGIAGRQVRAENPATLFVWPVWLEGVGVLAMLFGSPWRTLSPWRAAYGWLVRLEGEEVAVLGEYPDWLGTWPALVGFLGWFGVAATLTPLPRSPRATTALVAGYAAVMVVGAVAFGPAWFRRADALAVLYRLFGRVAPLPLERTDDGGYALVARPPWRGCTPPVRDPVVAAFVVAAVYTVSFDGFTSTPEFGTVLSAVRDAAGAGPAASVALYLAGTAGFVAAFWGVAWLAERASAGDSLDARGAALAFAPTLLPIAAAYEVAHAYPWIAANAGQLVTVLAGYVVAAPPAVAPLAWLSLPAFWGSQVALVVAGHVAAVVASHGVAVRRYDDPTRSHVPLTALMVGYTVLSLWIVSRPVAA